MSKLDRAVVDRGGALRAFARGLRRALGIALRILAVVMVAVGPPMPPPPPPPPARIEAGAETEEDEEP